MKAKICAYPGCSKVISANCYYCEEHKKKQDKRKAEHTKEWSKRACRTKSSEYHELYESALWRNIRKDFLAKYPTCFICGEKATIADHIIPHRGNLELFYDENNLQPMCQRCHSRKTRAESRKDFNR